MARRRAGILVLPAKLSDLDYWRRRCAGAGRLDDLIEFGPGSGRVFDWLTQEINAPGGSVASANSLLRTVAEMQNRSSSQGGERFWDVAIERHGRNAIEAVWRAYGRCSVADLYQFLTSAARTEEEKASVAWQRSAAAQTLYLAMKNRPGRDCDLVIEYWLNEWVRVPERTQAPIFTGSIQVLTGLLTGPVGETMAGDRGENPVGPADVLGGKVVVVAYPTLTYQQPGQMAQAIWKIMVQRACLRRVADDNTPPTVIFADECQQTMLPDGIDARVQAVARSHKLIQVGITQTLPGIYEAIGGGPKAVQECQSWLGNMQTKICCQNAEPETCEALSKMVGVSRQFMTNVSGAGKEYDLVDDLSGQGCRGGGVGMNEQLVPEILPTEWTKLAKGGRQSGNQVEAIVFQGGRRFSSGKTWIRTTFQQRY